MAHKTGNEETEFKVAPPCLNSRAATQNTPPQPITPPPQMTSSSTPSQPMTSSPSPLMRSPSPASQMMTSSSPPLQSAPHLLTSSSPSLQSPKSAFPRSSPVLTSSSTSSPVLTSSSASPRSSPVVKLANSEEEGEEEEEGKSSMSMAMKRKVNRCSGCWKKVGLTGIRCRCGQLFCSSHRYSDRHDCTFDYKSSGREAIARENPIIKAAKIVRI